MKKFIFQFSDKGRKTFLSLPKKIRNRIEEKLRFYIAQPDPLKFSESLKGRKDEFRYRIEDYRVIFRKDDQLNFVILVILKVGNRRDIY